MATTPDITQRRLPLHVEQRTVFVDLGTVRSHFRCDAETVFAKIDNGELPWAFDVGLSGRRDLRVWLTSLIAPEHAATRTLAQAIECIVGQGTAIRRGEIERSWIVSAQHIGRLIHAGEFTLVSPSLVSRLSLITFLSRRHQGNPKVMG